MRQIILLIAAVAMVGCSKKDLPPQSETKAESKKAADRAEPPKTEPEKQVPPKVEPETSKPPKTEPKALAKIPANAFVDSLGMPFVPVPGTEVQFCIWETRVKDYSAYAVVKAEGDGDWKKPGFKQEESHPVVNVSWDDAKEFCTWLTKKELAEGKIKAGQKYRLPTDSEWSVAVGLGQEKGETPEEKQMGVKGVYPWGKGRPPVVVPSRLHDPRLSRQLQRISVCVGE